MFFTLKNMLNSVNLTKKNKHVWHLSVAGKTKADK